MKLRARLSRRRLVGLASLTALAALVNQPKEAAALENCYWWKSGDYYCSGGTLYETWCWRCCASTDCWIEWCEARAVGSC